MVVKKVITGKDKFLVVQDSVCQDPTREKKGNTFMISKKELGEHRAGPPPEPEVTASSLKFLPTTVCVQSSFQAKFRYNYPSNHSLCLKLFSTIVQV